MLGEINGELDFRTADEQAKGFIKSGDTRNDDGSDTGSGVKTAPGASQSGDQGILDFKLNMSYDTATRKLTQLLALGSTRKPVTDGCPEKAAAPLPIPWEAS